jgi:hypothetical protein
MMTATGVTVLAAALAATGSDLAPWLIGAGIVIVLGAAALIIGQVVRSRRAGAAQADAAASLADAASGAATGSGTGAGDDKDAGAAGSGTDPISPDDPR